jgi:hypothetical protein
MRWPARHPVLNRRFPSSIQNAVLIHTSTAEQEFMDLTRKVNGMFEWRDSCSPSVWMIDSKTGLRGCGPSRGRRAVPARHRPVRDIAFEAKQIAAAATGFCDLFYASCFMSFQVLGRTVPV